MESCTVENCDGLAKYGLLYGYPLCCEKHKAYNYRNVLKCCTYPNCIEPPEYGYSPKTSDLRCARHRKEYHINLVKLLCKQDGCYKRATYGKSRTYPLTCADHKKPGYYDICCYTCQFTGCQSNVSDGWFCRIHNSIDIYKLKSCMCQYKQCHNPAYYGPNRNTTIRCNNHRRATDMHTVDYKCTRSDCSNYAMYGTSNFPVFCNAHKRDTDYYCDPVNITIMPCLICTNIALYGEFIDTPLHCREHRLFNEYNVTLVNKCRGSATCLRPALYGIRFGNPITCADHNLGNYVSVRKQLCRNCGEDATYGYNYGHPTKCFDHKHYMHRDVQIKKCADASCYNVAMYHSPENAVYCAVHASPKCFDINVNLIPLKIEFKYGDNPINYM